MKLSIIAVNRDNSPRGHYWAIANAKTGKGYRYRKLTRLQAAKLINISPGLFMVKV